MTSRPEVDISVKSNKSALEIRQMLDILPEDETIAPSMTNGDHLNTTDPVQRAILEQIRQACEERDKAMIEYLKAEPKAQRASSEARNRHDRVRRSNHRALKLREALEALKAVPRA